jgi:putative intracellular protease/amidase
MELMLTKEVNVMTRMLEDAGFEVQVASVSGQPIVGTATTLKPDLKLADVKIEDYVGFILPCMAAQNAEKEVPPEAVEVVKRAAAQGKPLAAQVSGVIILGKAGVLNGKDYAIYPDYRFFIPTGATWKGAGVVEDGSITTSGSCPYGERHAGQTDGTVELTQRFIAALEAAH